MYNVRATLIGLGSTFALVVMFEAIGAQIWHFTDGIDMNNKDAVRAALAHAPLVAMIYLIASYGVAGLFGSFLARKMAGGISTRPSRTVAIGLLVACVFNTVTVPEPMWVSIASVLIPLPAAFLGMKLAAPKLVPSNIARG
ncbi:MAG: hypothetical protein ABJC26_16915 [Gemmatimonadaceae bacterium]